MESTKHEALGGTLLARSSHPLPERVFVNYLLDNRKVVSAVGRHAIVQAWEAASSSPSLVDQIIAEIDRSPARAQLKQVAVVPLRVGAAGTAGTNPVTVLILVSPDTMTSEDAEKIANTCHHILVKYVNQSSLPLQFGPDADA